MGVRSRPTDLRLPYGKRTGVTAVDRLNIVTLDGNSVLINYPDDEKRVKVESEKLTSRAGGLAGQGDCKRALPLWKRGLQLQPSLLVAHRDMAMAYSQMGDDDSAKGHLIDLLRIDPPDVGGLVVLARIYGENERDYAAGERFARRAVEVALEDARALNSLGAVLFHTDRLEEAIPLFRAAIVANPELAAPYGSLAFIFLKQRRAAIVSAPINAQTGPDLRRGGRSAGEFWPLRCRGRRPATRERSNAATQSPCFGPRPKELERPSPLVRGKSDRWINSGRLGEE